MVLEVHAVGVGLRGERPKQADKDQHNDDREPTLAAERAEGTAALQVVAPQQQTDVAAGGHGGGTGDAHETHAKWFAKRFGPKYSGGTWVRFPCDSRAFRTPR